MNEYTKEKEEETGERERERTEVCSTIFASLFLAHVIMKSVPTIKCKRITRQHVLVAYDTIIIIIVLS